MHHLRSSAQYLELYHTELDAVDRRAHELLDELDDDRFNDDRFNWKPAPAVWSLGQCVAHLTKFNGLYLDALTRSLDNAKRQRLADDGKPFKYGFFERFFLWANEPPPKFKVKAPKPVQIGEESYAPAETKAKYFETHEQFRTALDEAQGVDLKRAQVTSPLNQRVKISLAAGFAVVLVHERRHLWQAARLVRR